MRPVIRKAETKDVESIALIESECSGMPWTAEQIEEEISYSLAHNYVAEIEGKIVGFFSMHIVSDDAHLNEFGVTEMYRRQGIGSMLAEKMIELCKENSCSVFSLEVREHSKPARNLYEKMGCVLTGVRKSFYSNPKEDACIYIMSFEGE